MLDENTKTSVTGAHGENGGWKVNYGFEEEYRNMRRREDGHGRHPPRPNLIGKSKPRTSDFGKT